MIFLYIIFFIFIDSHKLTFKDLLDNKLPNIVQKCLSSNTKTPKGKLPTNFRILVWEKFDDHLNEFNNRINESTEKLFQKPTDLKENNIYDGIVLSSEPDLQAALVNISK